MVWNNSSLKRVHSWRPDLLSFLWAGLREMDNSVLTVLISRYVPHHSTAKTMLTNHNEFYHEQCYFWQHVLHCSPPFIPQMQPAERHQSLTCLTSFELWRRMMKFMLLWCLSGVTMCPAINWKNATNTLTFTWQTQIFSDGFCSKSILSALCTITTCHITRAVLCHHRSNKVWFIHLSVWQTCLIYITYDHKGDTLTSNTLLQHWLPSEDNVISISKTNHSEMRARWRAVCSERHCLLRQHALHTANRNGQRWRVVSWWYQNRWWDCVRR